ncbi:MAG TPA: NAD(P)H-binding protein [Polyangiaceae bacterium]
MTTENTETAPQTILILGGTGKTGSRVAKRLAERGVTARVASRSGDVRFDWDDSSAWPAALKGVDALYLTYYPDLASPRAAGQIRELARLAVTSGVGRIVLISGRGEPHCHAGENAVRESGIPCTILRCAWFAQNFSEGHLRDQVLSGELAFPAGDVAEPFVDLDDVADVAVEALTNPEHEGKIYELSGPRLLTFGDACREIAKASGHQVRYVSVSLQSYREVLATVMPPDVAGFLCELFAYVLDGHNAFIDGDIERVLGRKARDFTSYAERAADAGAWRTAP